MTKWLFVFLLMPLLTLGATRDVVPNADGEGNLGNSGKEWNTVRAKEYYINGVLFTNTPGGGISDTNLQVQINSAFQAITNNNTNVLNQLDIVQGGVTQATWWLNNNSSTNRIALRASGNDMLSLRTSNDAAYASLTVSNLILLGTSTVVETTLVNIETNYICLNSNFTNPIAPVLDATFKVMRGSSPDAWIFWNETLGRWFFGTAGNLQDTTLYVSNLIVDLDISEQLSTNMQVQITSISTNAAAHDIISSNHTVQIGYINTATQNMQAALSTVITNGATNTIGIARLNQATQSMQTALTSISTNVLAHDIISSNHTSQIGALNTATQNMQTALSSVTTNLATNIVLIADLNLATQNMQTVLSTALQPASTNALQMVISGIQVSNGLLTLAVGELYAATQSMQNVLTTALQPSATNNAITNIVAGQYITLGRTGAVYTITGQSGISTQDVVSITSTSIWSIAQMPADVVTNGANMTRRATLNGTNYLINGEAAATNGLASLLYVDAATNTVMTNIAARGYLTNEPLWQSASSVVFYTDGRYAGGRSAWGAGLSIANIDPSAGGAAQHGGGSGTMTIGANSVGASQWAYINGNIRIGSWGYGAEQRVYSGGTAKTAIGDNAAGASQRGYNSAGLVTNDAIGALQLFNFGMGFTGTSRVTSAGSASIVLGAGTASNSCSIVAGDGEVSHGTGSATFGGDVWSMGTNLSARTALSITNNQTGVTLDGTFTGTISKQASATNADTVGTVATSDIVTNGADMTRRVTLNGTNYLITGEGGDVYIAGTNNFTAPSNTFLGSVFITNRLGVGTNSGSSLGQIVLKSSTSTNDGIRFGETMALYQGSDGYLNTLGGLTIGSGLNVGYIYCPLLINGLNLDMKFALRTDNTKRFLWTDYSFATNYMSLTNNGGVGQLAVANLVATNLISGNGYGITNIPAANIVGLVSGNTYTFVNTNLAAGTVVTNGGIVLIGTNALTGGGIQLGDSYTNLSGFAVISYPSATTLVVNAMAQGVVDMTLATNIVIQAPTNAVNGRSLEYWILASGADRTVTFPTNNFRIPSSSSMTNVLIVTNGTMSQFGIRYDMQRNRWIMKSYVWGY